MSKILLISDHGDPLASLGGEQAGGQNNYVYHLAQALDGLGHRVDVVTHWSDPTAPQVEDFGARCQVIRCAAGHKGHVAKEAMYDYLPALYAEVQAALDLSTYQIVHTHYWLSGMLGMWLHQQYDLPFVHTPHSLAVTKQTATGQLDTRQREAEHEILHAAQAVIATTRFERDVIYDCTATSAPVHVIPCGVNPIYTPRSPEPGADQTSDVSLLFVGRLVEEKGIFTLLEAFRFLIRHSLLQASMRLIIAGGEPHSINHTTHWPHDPAFAGYAQDLQGKVIFLGPQTPASLAGHYNAATATVVPSDYGSFSIVAAESLACGTPVIASRVGGIHDIIVHATTGLLVEPQSPVNMATMMQLVAMDPQFAATMGQLGHHTATQRFRWDTLVHDIEALYIQVGDIDSPTAETPRT